MDIEVGFGWYVRHYVIPQVAPTERSDWSEHTERDPIRVLVGRNAFPGKRRYNEQEVFHFQSVQSILILYFLSCPWYDPNIILKGVLCHNRTLLTYCSHEGEKISVDMGAARWAVSGANVLPRGEHGSEGGEGGGVLLEGLQFVPQFHHGLRHHGLLVLILALQVGQSHLRCLEEEQVLGTRQEGHEGFYVYRWPSV